MHRGTVMVPPADERPEYYNYYLAVVSLPFSPFKSLPHEYMTNLT